MKSLSVIQHTSADYLGLIEDHLEGRKIRFRYYRPFSDGGILPQGDVGDGLILLGGGPWGSAGARDLPTLKSEIALARACYMNGLPIIGIGLGAQIVSLACDGGSAPAPLSLRVGATLRTDARALNGFLPEKMPHIVYMRDEPRPPSFAKTLAIDDSGKPAVFQIGEKVFGFTGHPGAKRAIIEDLVMEFDEAPENPGPAIDAVGDLKAEIEDSLIAVMTGLIQKTGLMQN